MDPKKTSSADLAETLLKAQESGEKDAALDAALNTQGFAEFVALHKDSDRILEGGARTDEVIKAFEKKDDLIESAQKILTEQVAREIGKDKELQFSKEDLAGVEEYLSKMAVEDTEGFLKLAEKSEQYQADTAEIKGLESRLKELGADINKGVEANAIGSTKESLQEKKYVLGSVKGTDYASRALQTIGSWVGFGQTKNGILGANREAAQEKYGMETNWYGKIKNVDQQIEITQGLIELQDLKKSLVQDIFPSDVLEPIIQTRVGKYLSDMASSQKLEDLEKAQEFLERARLASEKGDTGTDYLGGMDEAGAQEAIDAALTAAIATRIDETISKSTLGNNALSRLEKSLSDFMKKEKLGSKDKDGYKDFLVKTLEEQAELLSKDESSKAKAVLIKRIIIKINNA